MASEGNARALKMAGEENGIYIYRRNRSCSSRRSQLGLVGLFKFDLVAAVTGSKFGEVNVVSRIVYVLVLVAGVLAAASIPKIA